MCMRLTSTQQGREKRPLRVFLEAGPSPPQRNVQMADAMHNSAVILLLISHSTFDGVDTLSDARGSPLHQMLWQYDMALELLECGTYHSKHRRLVPLLIGKKGAQSGCPKFEDIDENADHGEFWPINKMPDVQVKSIMEDALLGLRRDAQVAKGLEAKMMSCARDTPSILRGCAFKKCFIILQLFSFLTCTALPASSDFGPCILFCCALNNIIDIPPLLLYSFCQVAPFSRQSAPLVHAISSKFGLCKDARIMPWEISAGGSKMLWTKFTDNRISASSRVGV